jgi:hypothetical protein
MLAESAHRQHSLTASRSLVLDLIPPSLFIAAEKNCFSEKGSFLFFLLLHLTQVAPSDA